MDVGEPEEAAGGRTLSSSPNDEAPGEPPKPYLVDLYKFTVEMADKVSARRATANSFFLAIHTGLSAFVGVLAQVRDSNATPKVPDQDDFPLIVTAIAGVTLSATWWLLLRSYRDLNKAKFDVILEIEKAHLPIQPFTREWEFLKKDPIPWWRARYAELSFVEQVVPIVFVIVYGALAARVWTS